HWGTQHMGLYTFATSLKHLGLYQKFGFWPRFLSIQMEKKVEKAGASPVANGVSGPIEMSWTKFSDVPAEGREGMLGRCRALTGKVFEGLDVGVDIRSVAEQGLGETVLLWTRDELVGLAVCHCGAGTEAGSGICYIKFGAIYPALTGDLEFRRLLQACEDLAAKRGLEKVSGGINTARQEAWAAMLDSGWRGQMAGVAMQRPNEPGYNKPGVFLIDDWR
ncbi:MAG TPA: hypothetical protein VKQ52_15795, partial [Puia sp.]|nr:hypothetical protein [Puia sp.]